MQRERANQTAKNLADNFRHPELAKNIAEKVSGNKEHRYRKEEFRDLKIFYRYCHFISGSLIHHLIFPITISSQDA